jgi:hypothetical protein
MNGLHRTLVAALVACAVLVVPMGAVGQTSAVVPPSLQALEQKMAQIRFNTARISARFGLGELGPGGGGAELGAGASGAKGGLLTSTVGVFRLSPPEATATTKIEFLGLKPGERAPAGSAASMERVIGNTIYTYTPSLDRHDGGRPWLRSKQPSPELNGESAGLPALSDALAPMLSAGGGRNASAAPFAKLIEDVNGALSVQEVGPMTVDGQQVTEFTASLSFAKLLSRKQLEAFTKSLSSLGELLSPTGSPKQREEVKKHNEETTKKLSEATVELELFIAPSGLPVRMISVFGGRSAGIGGEEDILALEVPVHVHAPPARETIGQAQLRKLDRKRLCRITSVHAASNAEPVLCPKSAAKRTPRREMAK